MKVIDVMSHPVISATPDTTVEAAERLLARHGISALPVLDASGDIVGIVSDGDLRRLDASGHASRTVGAIMTTPVLAVPEQAAITQAARVMIEAGVKRVPVMRGRHLVGIISRGDLVDVLARGGR